MIASHPEMTQLLEYLEQPDAAAHAATLAHLTDCAHCRTRASRLATFTTQLRRRLPLLGQAETNHDPAELKAHLHAATHGAALRADLAHEAGKVVATPRASSIAQRIAALFTVRLPLWVPATAAVALLVIVLGLPRYDSDSAPLAAYQDAPVVRFQTDASTQPGIGFFSAASTVERPFAGVVVTRPEKDVLALRWPAIENATDYEVIVNRIDGNARRPATVITTSDTLIRVADFEFVAHSRYEWEIRGKTRDGARFNATGGFVVP